MKRFIYILLIVVVVLGGLYFRPLPKVEAVIKPPTLPPTGQVSLEWPDYGQSAFGGVGYGVLATNNTQKSVPIASIAKIVTAISVLQKKPLNVGQQGPKLTIGHTDINLYQNYVKQDGSVVPVNFGEEITEYQLMQALLLPSGNNIADTLANWAFGSQTAYLNYANNYVKSLGLNQTHLADASGFSPKTVSSAHDLVILGEKLLDYPVLASVVSQSEANIPIAGPEDNVNWLLGSDGVVGIKTGNTDQAGGCFLFAAKRKINGQQIEVVGAILSAPDRDTAIRDSQPLIEGADSDFQVAQIAKKGQTVGTYRAKWGASSPVIASRDLTVVSWKGAQPKVKPNFNKLSASTAAGQNAGTINVTIGTETSKTPVILQQKIAAPSPIWRIFHF